MDHSHQVSTETDDNQELTGAVSARQTRRQRSREVHQT
jgi:hypothetical protein